MHRRDVIRLLSLSGLALAGGGALAACGDSGSGTADVPGASDTGTDVQLVSADVARVPGDDAALPGMVAALHASGASLLGSVVGELPGNVAISPYSILVAMALVLNGAEGETRRQLLGLYRDATAETVNSGLNALTTRIESLSGPVRKIEGTRTELVLEATNAMFGQAGETWERAFLEVLGKQYGAGLQTVDFVAATESARGAINTWTAEQTHDKIPEIIPTGVLNTLTRFVLVNTLYLKAPWDLPFDAALTRPGPFTRLDGSTVDVPLMRHYVDLYLPVATGDGWTAVQLAYAGREVAMTVLLPDLGRYEDVESQVVGGALPDVLAALAPAEVAMVLPSWTFRTQAAVVPALRSLGVDDAFEDVADFSAMTLDEPLFLADVLHEVFIAVDEEGTEAAAATAAIGQAQSASIPVEVVVDRPFLFLIHDVEHGTPLFLGRVLDPSQT